MEKSFFHIHNRNCTKAFLYRFFFIAFTYIFFPANRWSVMLCGCGFDVINPCMASYTTHTGLTILNDTNQQWKGSRCSLSLYRSVCVFIQQLHKVNKLFFSAKKDKKADILWDHSTFRRRNKNELPTIRKWIKKNFQRAFSVYTNTTNRYKNRINFV